MSTRRADNADTNTRRVRKEDAAMYPKNTTDIYAS